MAGRKKIHPKTPVQDYDWQSTAIVGKVSDALGRRWSLADIRSIIAKDIGETLGTEPRRPGKNVEQAILKAARDDLSERLDLDRKYEKALALEFYESVIRQDGIEIKDQIKAQERIDAILGLDAKYDSGKETAENIAERIRKAINALANVHEDGS